MRPPEFLTDEEVEQHLYECREARWLAIAAGVAIWFLGVCAIFHWGPK